MHVSPLGVDLGSVAPTSSDTILSPVVEVQVEITCKAIHARPQQAGNQKGSSSVLNEVQVVH